MTKYTDDRRAPLWTVCIAFMIFSTVAVSLRCYVRAIVIKSFGWDDGLMVACYFFYVLFLACAMGGLRYGTGLHYDELDPDRAEIALLYWFLCEVWYVFASGLGKIAVGVFLLRICVKPWHKWVIKLLNAGTVVFCTFYFIIFVIQCHPVKSFWTETPASENCNDPHIITYATYAASAVNSAADWTLGCLPILIVWDIQMKKRTKVTVALILGLAAIGNTATIVRIPFVNSFLDTEDFLWATTWIAVCSTLELGIGITAACIATLRPLLSRRGDSTTASNGYLNSHGYGGNSALRSKKANRTNGYSDIDLEARTPSRIHNHIGKNMTLTETTITRSSSEPDEFSKYGAEFSAAGHARTGSKKYWRGSDSQETFANDGLEINKSVGVEVTFSDAGNKEKASAREVV